MWRKLIWLEEEGRPRLLWRLVGQLLLLVLSLMVVDGVLSPLATAWPRYGGYVAETVGSVLGFILSVAVAGRW
ncbi:MAG TPA: hypothetical protein VLL52_21030, partial [Anaerolineae bacterium]|nr:hypothetical protein [Anaerolineae bacterium]